MMARYILSKRDDAAWKARDQKAVQQAIYDGCAWLDANWSPYDNPQKRSENVYHIYYMYCIERAFDLIGNRLLGKHPWYEEMARQLTGRQDPKGFWDSKASHKPERGARHLLRAALPAPFDQGRHPVRLDHGRRRRAPGGQPRQVASVGPVAASRRESACGPGERVLARAALVPGWRPPALRGRLRRGAPPRRPPTSGSRRARAPPRAARTRPPRDRAGPSPRPSGRRARGPPRAASRPRPPASRRGVA